jgi:hypothetical protein
VCGSMFQVQGSNYLLRMSDKLGKCVEHGTLNLERLFRALLHPAQLSVININSRAGVVEWQTRRTQNPVGATLCGFKSRLRHQKKAIT